MHTDATEFSNSSLYSTAEMRYASLPSPHIKGSSVLSNYKNTHDHSYHNIPMNVHYFLIVNKDIYFEKSSFLLIYLKILANIIYLPLIRKNIKKSHGIKNISLIQGNPMDFLDQIPLYFSDRFCSFFFFPADCKLSSMPQDPAPGDRNPNGSHRPKLMTFPAIHFLGIISSHALNIA